LGDNPNDSNDPTDDPTTVALTPAPAGLTGTVWLDRDKDDVIDPNEDRKANWTLKVKDSNGNVVATETTDSNGEYSVTGLIPGEYTVEFFNPNGVHIATSSTNGALLPNQTINLPLPVDPSGVVYDSVTRTPLSGVTVQLVNSSGTPIADSCLGVNQQSQVTLADGLYKFDVFPAADATCPDGETYTIRIANPPAGYAAVSTTIPAQTGVYDGDANEANCTVDSIAASGSCEVQAQPDQPTGNQNTTYFMDFILNSGDNNIIFNHIPLDALLPSKDPSGPITLTKSVNKKQVSIGDQLYYSVVAENTTAAPLNIDILDDLPAGFKFVGSTANMTTAGPDGKLDAGNDDVISTVNLKGTKRDPVRFGVIAVPAGERVRIGYLIKIGTGSRQGAAINKAQAYEPDSSTIILSNLATAQVIVLEESALDSSTLIGKVFHDRDSDGYQDSATISSIKVQSGKWIKSLGGLKGRVSMLDKPNSKTIRVPNTGSNHIRVTTKEGIIISIDNRGQQTESHTGLKAKGLTAQELMVTTKVVGNTTEVTMINLGVHEEGIPGVRLATVKGLLIETDGYGRYHIPDAISGRRGLGKNFILKVDDATLPEGATFTTENPRVLRLTGAALNKINFGVKLPGQVAPQTHVKAPAKYEVQTRRSVVSKQVPVYKTVEVKLGSIFFDKDKHHIRADQRGNMELLAARIKRYGKGHITIDAFTDSRHNAQYNIALAKRRANTIRFELQKRLGARLMQQVKVDVDKRAYTEVPHNDPDAIDYRKAN
jgi:uncharacterized repeat protein (TIGR01451 family)